MTLLMAMVSNLILRNHFHLAEGIHVAAYGYCLSSMYRYYHFFFFVIVLSVLTFFLIFSIGLLASVVIAVASFSNILDL